MAADGLPDVTSWPSCKLTMTICRCSKRRAPRPCLRRTLKDHWSTTALGSGTRATGRAPGDPAAWRPRARGNWGYQVPAVIASGYRAVLIDSRGHGRSTRDSGPINYELMASDVLAVMDLLLWKRALCRLERWRLHRFDSRDQGSGPHCGVFFFACNMDPSGSRVHPAQSASRPLFPAARQGLSGYPPPRTNSRHSSRRSV